MLESFEDEIVDRLFVLNAQRAEEKRLGLAAAGQGKEKGAAREEERVVRA